jgi:hypothetical protein
MAKASGTVLMRFEDGDRIDFGRRSDRKAVRFCGFGPVEGVAGAAREEG